jgi:hypothetical protein
MFLTKGVVHSREKRRKDREREKRMLVWACRQMRAKRPIVGKKR